MWATPDPAIFLVSFVNIQSGWPKYLLPGLVLELIVLIDINWSNVSIGYLSL